MAIGVVNRGDTYSPPIVPGGSGPVAPKLGPANPPTRPQARSPESSCPSLPPEACLPERSRAPVAEDEWLVDVSVYENATCVAFGGGRGAWSGRKWDISQFLQRGTPPPETLGNPPNGCRALVNPRDFFLE